MRLYLRWGALSARLGRAACGAESLSALAEPLPDPVEFLGDRAQPLSLLFSTWRNGDGEQRGLLADEVLDPREQLQLVPDW
jgi:hypothetical protein